MDSIAVCDLRTVSFDVPPQEILTKDSVTVAVDAVIYYKIAHPMSAICNIADYSSSTKVRFIMTSNVSFPSIICGV